MKITDKKLTFKEKILRGHYLYFLYYYLYTRITDHRIAGTSLDVFECNPGEEIFPVQSATYRVLKQLLPEIEIHKDDIFADIGCGRGRLLGYLFLNNIRGKKNYGVDINREAADFAGKVFRNDDCTEIIHGDATKVTIADGTVFLLYNPFGRTVLEQFLDHLEKTVRPGCRVYYLHAVYEECFTEREDSWKWKKE